MSINPLSSSADWKTNQKPYVVIIAGPTCSGKSYLALHLAQQLNGMVINADAMQCYRDLRIITARPTEEDEQLVSHCLYGVLPWDQVGNAAWWRNEAIKTINSCLQEGKLPLLCGGTGMYFHALINGIALIPEPSSEARKEARSDVDTYGSIHIHQRLLEVDPITAQRLNPQDSQRIARAWEVWLSTGHGLSYWQKKPALPPANYQFIAIRLAPPRDVLRQAVAARFEKMIKAGACEEVAHFLSLNPPPDIPLRRAHGVPELIAYLSNHLSLSQAIEQAVVNTQRYIKRQTTWFAHHQLASEGKNYNFNLKIDSFKKYSESFIENSVLFIRNLIDDL